MTLRHPKSEHDRRSQFLNDLGILFGCTRPSMGGLPDGRHPDVMRIDTDRELLFIGDAKDTETPGNIETQVRLRHYLEWIVAHVINGRDAVFAICFGSGQQVLQWIETVNYLAKDIGLAEERHGSQRFDRGTRVVWFIYRANGTKKAS